MEKYIYTLIKVRVGNLKSNKAATLYQTESCVVSISSSPDGNAIMTGHLDGSINRFFFDDGTSGASQGKYTSHHCAPMCLIWAETVAAVGPDRVIVFYDSEGKVLQNFDYSKDEEIQEITVVNQNPTGQCVVFSGFGKYNINLLDYLFLILYCPRGCGKRLNQR